MFYDELDLLEIRLHELVAVVDWFVLVEAHYDFKGHKKPLIFAENASRFEQYLSKIRYVECRHMPATSPVHDEEYWENEGHQRAMIRLALDDCGSDDLILVSDCDEIPRASVIPAIPRDHRRYRLELDTYHFDFNHRDDHWRQTGAYSSGIGAATYHWLMHSAHGNPSSIRSCDERLAIPNAGWHFSWFGGKEKVDQKVGWYSHGLQMDHNRVNPVSGTRLTYVADPLSTLPEHVRANPERFSHFFAPPPRTASYRAAA
jgi:beta-1,4-mannosyl-glycoprotein beta-1,4-N-acetylglucosaminyltransferase